MEMTTATIEAAIREAFPIPAEVRKHAGWANYDLYYGPAAVDDPEYRSWSESLRVLTDWLDECGTAYVCDESGCVMASEPQGEWYDPETGEYLSDPYDSADPDACEYVEPMPYWEIGPREIAAAYGYAALYDYA
jgi:hypothetical protein